MKKQIQNIQWRMSLLVVVSAMLSTSFSPGDSSKKALILQNDTLSADPIAAYSPYDETSNNWADSIMDTMSEEERIAQLFMVAAYSNKDEDHVAEISKLVTEQKIGGLIFFQGGPMRQVKLTNKYQSLAKVPLMISMDAEWGLAMRLDSTLKYPRQMTLGAITDDSLIYQMGTHIAEQCKRIGVHVNLAPVVDVNNNAENPVINSRSFGENKQKVAEKSIAYMRGLQDRQVLANAKHFPGHGDTDADSHKSLPIINHSRERLNDIELYPFEKIIDAGIGSIMVAHLFIPSLDSTLNLASTLSKPIVTGLLKEELGFEGLIFTDALNMKGVSAYHKPGIVDVMALLAGNDVLLFSEDVPTALIEIKLAIQNGEISQSDIDKRCRKILKVKKWQGLDHQDSISTENLHADLHKPKYKRLMQKLSKEAITLVKNQSDLLPLKRLDTLKIASVSIGANLITSFQKEMDSYATVKHFQISKKPTIDEIQKLIVELEEFNTVIVGVHRMNERVKRNFGITTEAINLIGQLNSNKCLILDVFGNPYSLGKIFGTEEIASIIVSYHDTEVMQKYSAQMIFGGVEAKGTLPVTASIEFPSGTGIITEATRFGYATPEELGIESADFDRIDQIVLEAIEEKVMPGCQVLIAKNKKIIYQKAFGHHTYDKHIEVKNSDLYDIASITKIAATVPSLMKLQDMGLVNLNDNLCDHLPGLVDTTEYMNLNLRMMLAHHSGLVSWIPFYENTLSKGVPRFDVYSLAASEEYPHRVADKFYIHKDYKAKMYERILGTSLKNIGQYKYSDLGYYMMQKIIEDKTHMSLNEFVDSTFYKKMGMTTMGYLPRERFELSQITPTEYDLTFRKQLIHGDVHDPGAAMLGGVGGHAGVFSNANDLAKLMQMYIDGGVYGGEHYLSEAVLKEFTACQFCDDESIDNRRGAGFDKPVREGAGGPTCQGISLESFGHSGFTGTLTWADPEEDLVYVFLSNRVHPDAGNYKLIKQGTRTQIMKQIYEAIRKADKEPVN